MKPKYLPKELSPQTFYVAVERTQEMFLQRRVTNRDCYQIVCLTDKLGSARIFSSELIALAALDKLNDHPYVFDIVPMVATFQT